MPSFAAYVAIAVLASTADDGPVPPAVRPESTTSVAAFCARAAAGAPDSVLIKAWRDPAPHRSRRVLVAPGVSLEVLTWGSIRGSRPAVVWLPGLNLSAHAFDDVATALAPAARQVAITFRGNGPFDEPSDGVRLSDNVDDVLAVLSALGIDRAVMVGHSRSGDVLTALARRAPGVVAGLVYVDAAYDRSSSLPALPDSLRRRAMRAMVEDARRGRADRSGYLVAARCAERRVLHAAEVTELVRRISEVRSTDSSQPATGDPARVARRAAELAYEDEIRGDWPGSGTEPEPSAPVFLLYAAQSTLRDYLRLYAASADPELAAALRRWWESSHGVELARQRDLAARYWPNASTRVVPDGEHVLMWSHPSVVGHAARAILTIASGISGRKR